MRTLGEIIEAAKAGEHPDYDELRLAVCALDALMTFDRDAIWKLAAAEQEGKRPMLVWSAVWQRDEQFGRVRRALAKSPRDFLGQTYDPDSPEVQARRRKALALFDRLAQQAGIRGKP